MSILNYRIQGLPRFLIVSLLSGLTFGLIGGALYGDAQAEAELARERTMIQADPDLNVRWRGEVPSKVSSGIYARWRARGLSRGVSVGLLSGIAVGLAGAALWFRRRILTDSPSTTGTARP